MAARQTYKSRFNAAEIDKRLAGIANKIDISSITQTITDDPTLVPSSKAVYDSLENIGDRLNPNQVRDLVGAADDSNIYTDADKEKVTNINIDFRGSYDSYIARDGGIDESTLNGGEIVFMTVGGRQFFQKWSDAAQEWQFVDFSTAFQKFTNLGVGDFELLLASQPVSGTIVVTGFDPTGAYMSRETIDIMVTQSTEILVSRYDRYDVNENFKIFEDLDARSDQATGEVYVTTDVKLAGVILIVDTTNLYLR